MIKIVGLGPGNKDTLTIKTIEELKNAENIFFRTKIHPTIEYVDSIGIKYSTYDYLYETIDNFDDIYMGVAKDLIEKHKEFGNVLYAVPGHPQVAEKSVENLINLCKENNIEYKIITAVSFIDVMIERLNIDPISGLKIIDAFDINNQVIDRRVGTIITQVYNKIIASDVKIALSEFYDDEKTIYFVRGAGLEQGEIIKEMPLYQLDWQEEIDYLTSIYIPKDSKNKYKDFYDLVRIIEILRGDNGCPWDREQDHKSIKEALLEECYEVINAIDNEDDENLTEELGDIMLHVVMHSVIGKEEGYFNENDIIKGICDKMINRHSHIFGDEKLKNSKEVIEKWSDIKRKEKNIKSISEDMKNITQALPALIKATKLQEKASEVNFDFDNVLSAMDKVIEELNEIKDVYKDENRSKILEEVGDLLFASVNVARLLDISAEMALNYNIEKFIKRFEGMEKLAEDKNLDFKNLSLEDKDKLWEEFKSINK